MYRMLGVLPILSLALSSGGQTAAEKGCHIRHIQSDAEHGTELTWRNSLKLSKDMTASDRVALMHAIESKLRPQMGNMDIHTEKKLARVAAETRIKLMDLDEDGIPEVVAQSFGLETCGAVGNCFLWVFKKSGTGYASILASGSQSFIMEKTKTNGFLDLTLVSHVSASEKGLTLYRYKSGKYREVACYDANWSPIINGPVLKRPVITPCGR